MSLFTHYKNDLINALNSIDNSKIDLIIQSVLNIKNNNKKVFLIGNGGSSATPSHSAGDWSKELSIKALCLSDNTPALTAFANDTDYSNVFKGQLEVFLEHGDLVIGYSGSGNSPNVINAIDYAKSKGNYTIGLTGNYKNGNGGKLAKIANLALVFDTLSMEVIEDLHLIVNHIIKEGIKLRLQEN